MNKKKLGERMYSFKITKKLNKAVLTDLKEVIKNQIIKTLDNIDANSLYFFNSSFFGLRLMAKTNKNIDISLFEYREDINTIYVHELLNEYRLIDCLEDYYQENIISK